MKHRRIVLGCALLAACATISSGCLSSDGGQSGTGISSAIRGNVVAVTGAAPDVADIDVSLAGTDLTTRTDANGRFELRGEVSGPAEVRFERQRDDLFASADVVIPAGGVLELERIELDSSTGEARPARQRVEFEGLVEALDCTGGTIRLIPQDDDPTATVFTVEVASATIRAGDVILMCDDLQVGDRVQVHGETTDGTTLVNAELVLEDDQDGEVEFEGVVEALDCAGGTIRVMPQDDDPTAPALIIEVASATIREGDVALSCEDLRVGDRVQVHGETTNGTTLLNAEVVREDGEDGEVEFEGVVEALDCAGGTIRVAPQDDDPTATAFIIEVASATIREGDVALGCEDLRVNDRVQIHGETIDGTALVNAEVVREGGEGGTRRPWAVIGEACPGGLGAGPSSRSDRMMNTCDDSVDTASTARAKRSVVREGH